MHTHTETLPHSQTHKHTKKADRNGVGSLVSPPAALSYAVRANRTHTGNSQNVFMSELHSDITDTHTHAGYALRRPSAALGSSQQAHMPCTSSGDNKTVQMER